MNDQEFKEKYDKLKYSKFYQQKMFGWRPLPTISCITIIFVCFAIFFIIMGIIILVFTAQVKEFKYKYYPCGNNPCPSPLFLNIKEDMKKPFMIYYQVDGIIQNHRFYMDSKSDKQLKGEDYLPDDLKKDKICESALTKGDIPWQNNNINNDDIANPCGLISKTFLNDRFYDWKIDGDTAIEEESEEEIQEIAYKSDIDTYKGVKENEVLGKNYQHFLVWMRPSPFSNPRKLWGRINKDIKQNSELAVKIDYNYNYPFYSNRYIILSTRNIFGGKSMFLGICYIIAGGLSLMASVIFITTYSSFHRKN